MSNAHPHPSADVLNGFLLGKLPDLEEAEVESHVTVCPACQARAATVCASDTFVELLAAAGANFNADAAPLTATLTAFATPSLAASTKAWDGPAPPVSSAPAILAGHAKYRVLRQLGVGGMGAVWLAEHTVMNRAVAVKVIRPDLLARPGATARFLREVQAAAKLHHPNIVTAFDAESVEDSCLLVMEYIEGEMLSDRVKAGPLPVDEACRAVRDAAGGLAHAHATGLIHRDVKPGNLIRAADGTTKVLDFGLVGFGESDGSGLTGENVVMGTPDYIAPEQAEDARTADARSDVYALGCTLYHLLAGRVPFPADTPVKKIDAHRSREPDPIPGIPEPLAAILRRLMAKRPDDRYQAAEAVADALEPFCAALAEPSAAQPAPARRRGHRWAIAAGLWLGLVALGAAGAVYKIQRDNEVIEIKTDDPDIEVVMKRNGELVRIVDTKTKQEWELDTNKMRLKPDGSELSIDLPGKEPLVIRRHGDVAVTVRREPKTGEPVPPIPNAVGELRQFGADGHSVIRVAVSADGTRALTAGSDRIARYWDVTTGKELLKLSHAVGQVYGAAITPDGSTLISCGEDGLIHLWNATTGAELRQLAGHKATVADVAVTPRGNLLASAGYDRTIRLWDWKTGEPVAVLVEHTAGLQGVAISPDGSRLASWSWDGAVRLWDVRTRKVLFRLDGHKQMVRAAKFSGDGSRLVTGEYVAALNDRGCLKAWDVTTGKLVQTIDGIVGGTHGLAVSADGSRALSGGLGGVVYLWDLNSGQEIATFRGHARFTSVGDLAFLPGERTALSTGGDATIRVWRLPDPPAIPAAKKP